MADPRGAEHDAECVHDPSGGAAHLDQEDKKNSRRQVLGEIALGPVTSLELIVPTLGADIDLGAGPISRNHQ